MAVLVTGGIRGIGFEIARAFAEPGATVFVNYRSDDETAQRAVSILAERGAEVRAIRGDVGTPEGCAALLEEVGRLCDRLDQLIHCAVRPLPGAVLEADPVAFNDALQVNGTALLYLVQAALPLMDRGASVVFLTSRGGRVVIPNYAAVGVGKVLAESLMRYLATELAPKGIRINAVGPAVVATEAVSALFGDQAEDLVATAAAVNPSGRGIEPGDYTNLIRWLTSDEAEYIQGQVIAVNGGANLMG